MAVEHRCECHSCTQSRLPQMAREREPEQALAEAKISRASEGQGPNVELSLVLVRQILDLFSSARVTRQTAKCVLRATEAHVDASTSILLG